MGFEVFQRTKGGGRPAGSRLAPKPPVCKFLKGSFTAVAFSPSAAEVSGLAVGDRVLALIDREAGAVAFKPCGSEGWRVSPSGKRGVQISVGKLLTRLGVPFGTYAYETIPGPDGEPLPGFRFKM